MIGAKQGRSAASYIMPMQATPGDRQGQNEAEYQRALAEVAADPVAIAFVAMVTGWGDASAFIEANHCARHWSPGTPATVSLAFQLRTAEGHNAFSYAGGGTDVANAVAKATAALELYTIDKLGDVLAWWARGRRWGGWRSHPGDFA